MIATEQYTEVSDHLREIIHALAATDAKEVLLPLIVDRMAEISQAEVIGVFGLDQSHRNLVPIVVRHGAEYQEGGASCIIPRKASMIDRALLERRSIVLSHPRGRTLDPIVAYYLGDSRLKLGFVIPLRVAGAERGGILVLNPATPGDRDRLLKKLTLYSDLAAIVLHRNRLRAGRSADSTRLKVLNSVLQVTTSGLEEEALIQRALDALLSFMPSDCVELFIEEGDQVHSRYSHGWAFDEERADNRDRFLGLHHIVMQSGKAIVEQGVRQGQSDAHLNLVSVPLHAEQNTLGTLLLGRYNNSYGQQDVDLLTTVGNHLGLGIELSRLLRRQALEAESLERALAENVQALQNQRTRIAELEEERQQLKSMATLGELAAGVAHDLNNALNPIVAFSELIREHATHPERIEMYADRILLAARGGAETIKRIQRFTQNRQDNLPSETISLTSLVSEVVELTRPSWSKPDRGGEIVVEESVEPGLRIEGNAGELRQALLNLIGNALDAMPNGGTLRLIGRSMGEDALLSIQDTGTGMPQEVCERALEPFFTTKGTHGTGLGLAEVFGIAERHGGYLELQSHSGVGTTITLRFPRSWAELAPCKVRRPMTEVAGNHYHILLVDDSLLSLEATAAALRAAGHTVATAPNGQVALRVFNAGRYDLVLSDLGLPDMHGLELVDRLRKIDPGVRIGVITGWALPEKDEELERHGVDMLFVKPVDTDQLLATI